MVWRRFKAEGKSPHPFSFFFFNNTNQFPNLFHTGFHKACTLSSLCFFSVSFLPHTARLPLRWRDVVSTTLDVCQQTVSKSLNHWMTELRLWVLAPRVQAVLEQEAAGGELQCVTSVSVTLCRTTSIPMLQWIIDLPSFLFLSLTKCQNVKCQLRKKGQF